MHTVMESSPLSSSPPLATNESVPYSGEDAEGNDENQSQAQFPFDDDEENDNIDRDQYRGAPSSLLGRSRPLSCNDMTSALQRRQRTNQADRGQLLEAQLQQQLQQRRRSQSVAEETEREEVLPATTTTMSQKSLFVLRPVHRYVDLVCIGLSVLAYLLETTMNAALAIFGIGVGVGLVLGDSFRAALPMLPSAQQHQQQGEVVSNNTMMAATVAQAGNELIAPRHVPNLLPAQ